MSARFTLRSGSETATFRLGQLFGETLRAGMTVLLSGGLGVGKTVFVRGVGEALGARHVRSPSFTLVNEYETGRLLLVHADLYRLELKGADDLGLEEFLRAGDAALLVEWPERWDDVPSDEVLRLNLKASSESEREIDISAYGPESERAARTVAETVRNGVPDVLLLMAWGENDA